jgi:hypothetical protein
MRGKQCQCLLSSSRPVAKCLESLNLHQGAFTRKLYLVRCYIVVRGILLLLLEVITM